MTESKIEWCERSDWNPVRGCTRVSPGCEKCYAERIAARFSDPGMAFHGFAYRGTNGPHWTGRVELVEHNLDKPLRWRKPARIFVNSTSDIFHEALPDEVIDKIFAVMALAPQHQFQVLTKRAERMREYMQALIAGKRRIGAALDAIGQDGLGGRVAVANAYGVKMGSGDGSPPYRPWPNVWLGVSCEDQQRADERIPLLLDTPAAVRFVSAEPLLGPVKLYIPTRPSFMRSDGKLNCDHCCNGDRCDDPTHWDRRRCPYCRGSGAAVKLDWVIVGGESGAGARPCDVQWIEDIVRQCQAAGVACFVKQLGAKPVYRPPYEWVDGGGRRPYDLNDRKGGDISEFPAELRVREMPA